MFPNGFEVWIAPNTKSKYLYLPKSMPRWPWCRLRRNPTWPIPTLVVARTKLRSCEKSSKLLYYRYVFPLL